MAADFGYVAVLDEDVVRRYQLHLARRRQLRPNDEYREATETEWQEFEEHLDKRKVDPGACGRPYGTPCAHEHVCVRCPMLHVEPQRSIGWKRSRRTSSLVEIVLSARAGAARSRASR